MRTLEFLNPVFAAGSNVTVRKGLKWSDVKPGETVNLAETGKDPFGTAKIKSIFVGTMLNIPNELLRREHDPKCRNFSGLFSVMKETYGNIAKNEVVTVLEFVVL